MDSAQSNNGVPPTPSPEQTSAAFDQLEMTFVNIVRVVASFHAELSRDFSKRWVERALTGQ